MKLGLSDIKVFQFLKTYNTIIAGEKIYGGFFIYIDKYVTKQYKDVNLGEFFRSNYMCYSFKNII